MNWRTYLIESATKEYTVRRELDLPLGWLLYGQSTYVPELIERYSNLMDVKANENEWRVIAYINNEYGILKEGSWKLYKIPKHCADWLFNTKGLLLSEHPSADKAKVAAIKHLEQRMINDPRLKALLNK